MKRTLKNLLLSLSLVFASVFVASSVPLVASADPGASTGGTTGINVFSNCGSTGASGAQICGAQSPSDFTKLITNIINTILFVLGIIAVIMIVIGGIRYTTSNGDSSQVKAAKDTILYSIVGLAVAIMAYAIVNFVIASLKK